MATAKKTKKVIVPAVEEVSATTYTLELHEDEAAAVFALLGQVNLGDDLTSGLYSAMVKAGVRGNLRAVTSTGNEPGAIFFKEKK